MSDLVTRLSVLAEDDGDRYPAHVKKLAEAAASRIAALEAQLAARTGAVKPLDLSNLLRHAFFEGFMVAGGSQEAAAEWWPEYDPETCVAYSRIVSALSPAPEAQQEAVAWQWRAYEDGGAVTDWHNWDWGDRRGWEAIAKRDPGKYEVRSRPLYTRPSEQAVTEAWRPIETAPKDGTPVLLARFDQPGVTDDDLGPDGATVGHWAHFPGGNGGWYLSGLGVVGDHGGDYHPGNGAFSNNGWPELDPTHWMPLPTPPALAQEGK